MTQFLHTAQIVVAVLVSAATLLLGFMFWNSSLTNTNAFTTRFLKILSVTAVCKGIEVVCATYRTARIATGNIPDDASLVTLAGRTIELAAYIFMVWFLLRPETKRALNGAAK